MPAQVERVRERDHVHRRRELLSVDAGRQRPSGIEGDARERRRDQQVDALEQLRQLADERGAPALGRAQLRRAEPRAQLEEREEAATPGIPVPLDQVAESRP